jgi:hypothetical protein
MTTVRLGMCAGSLLVFLFSCGGDGSSDIADMDHKQLAITIRPAAPYGSHDIVVWLISEGCPTLRADAFARLNGQTMILDPGTHGVRNPQLLATQCDDPFAFILIPADAGSVLVVEVGDRSQTVRAVIRYSGGGIMLQPLLSSIVPPGGEIVVPFLLAADSTLPIQATGNAFGGSASLTGFTSEGVIGASAIRFPVPPSDHNVSSTVVFDAMLQLAPSVVTFCENASCGSVEGASSGAGKEYSVIVESP